MGSGVNMGCGTITVNYDGKAKYRTTAGNDAFIGLHPISSAAPVTVGDFGAYVQLALLSPRTPSKNLAVARRDKNIPDWPDKRQ